MHKPNKTVIFAEGANEKEGRQASRDGSFRIWELLYYNKCMKYFDDYIDENGVLHVDTRKPQPKKVGEVNLRVKLSKSDKTYTLEELAAIEPKMILHHVNMLGDE